MMANLSIIKNGFASWDNFGSHQPEKCIKTSKICKGKICGRVLLLAKNIFVVVHSNFSYDSETYDLMKLYVESLLEILVSSQFICTHSILSNVFTQFTPV